MGRCIIVSFLLSLHYSETIYRHIVNIPVARFYAGGYHVGALRDRIILSTSGSGSLTGNGRNLAVEP